MKNKMSVLIAGLLLALVVVGVLGATNVYAQSQPNALLHGGGPGGRGLGLEGLQIAAEALISRATAYRYFPSVEALLLEASLDVAVPEADDLFAAYRRTTPLGVSSASIRRFTT